MFSTLLRFRRPQILFQVGAYLGDDGVIEASRAFGHHLFMFEPNPERVEDLRRKAGDAATIHLVPLAVSNYNGHATFNIAGYDDCSSLQEFDPGANQNWVHPWHPYKHFETVRQIEVEVIRLDRFLEEARLPHIDMLEIDAQGEDLRVVESLGERLRDVRKIQIEVNIHNAPLYRNSFTLEEALAFFDRHGFERHVSWKQSMGREANIVFRNRRMYPNRLKNTVCAAVEQWAIQAHIAWVKLPRVLAVTKMMMLRRLRGQAAQDA